jgi:hypothetical protein
MQACPQEFGRYQNRNHGGDNLKRGGEMAIDPMGLIFTKIHPETCCFVLMDGSLWQKNCGFKSLLQPIIVFETVKCR